MDRICSERGDFPCIIKIVLFLFCLTPISCRYRRPHCWTDHSRVDKKNVAEVELFSVLHLLVEQKTKVDIPSQLDAHTRADNNRDISANENLYNKSRFHYSKISVLKI